MNTCIFCFREFSNKGGLGSHQPFCKLNPNRRQRSKSPDAHTKKGAVPWNKGKVGILTAWNKGIKNSTLGKCKDPSKELTRREKLSQVAKDRKFGGYTQGSGRGKKGWYKGFFCDSSWELAYVIYCLDHNVNIARNTEKRQYVYREKIKNYIPDFIVENKLVEIKGYKTEEWLAKLKFNPDVSVFYKSDMEPILAYVINTYGKNYIDLYE